MAEKSDDQRDENRKVFDEFKKMIADAKLSPNMGRHFRCIGGI